MSVSSKPEFDKLTLWLGPLINWQNFGVFLPGIKREHIQSIQIDCRGIGHQKSELYDVWLRVNPNATWQDVITALETAQENALAAEIKKKLGQTTGTQGTTCIKEVNMDKLCKTLRDVIKRKYADLRQVLKPKVLSSVAAEMFSEGLISRPCKDDPTYDSVIGEFENGMQWKTSVEELEKHCQSFLNSLSIQGGPVQGAAIRLAEEWKKNVKEEFGVSLSLSA